MPPGFMYEEVFRRGRPVHGTPGKPATYDSFYIKHPPMKAGRRAKIFAPFDALKGFSERVLAKETVYESRRELTDGEREELDRRLSVLHRLVPDRRSALENRITISVTCYEACSDPENDAFEKLGTYETVTGVLMKIDLRRHRLLLIPEESINDGREEIAGEGRWIDAENIYQISGEGIFEA